MRWDIRQDKFARYQSLYFNYYLENYKSYNIDLHIVQTFYLYKIYNIGTSLLYTTQPNCELSMKIF